MTNTKDMVRATAEYLGKLALKREREERAKEKC